MSEMHEVVEGAVRKTAPYWLIILVSLLGITHVPNDYIQGALAFVVVVLMAAASYVAGFTEGMVKATPIIEDAATYMQDAASAVERLSAPYTLTGGGPLDGDTVPNPAEVSPRLLVYDPESEELEGCYVPHPTRPSVLVWQPTEGDPDALQE